jgi:hypothetical protein
VEKSKRYLRTFFQPRGINKAFEELEKHVRLHSSTAKGFSKKSSEPEIRIDKLSVSRDEEEFIYDSEAEFFIDYQKKPDSAIYRKYIGNCCLNLHFYGEGTTVAVKCDTRKGIELTFECFEDHAVSSKLPQPITIEKPSVKKSKRYSRTFGSMSLY